MKRVTELALYSEGIIMDITAEVLLRERLLELGVSPGRTLKVMRRLPLGGPIIVQAGSLCLALRLSEAEQVWVQ